MSKLIPGRPRSNHEKHFFRWVSTVALVAALATGAFYYRQHRAYVAMHTMPAELKGFSVNNPPPVCATWKEQMPRQRDPDVNQPYIKARTFWRSKVEWQFTSMQLLGILHDVDLAAQNGDSGARALLSHFYLTGLGPLDTNHVLDSDPDKGAAIIRTAVAAGQAWGYHDLGVAHEHGYGGAAYDEEIAWAYYLKAAELGSPDAQMALASAYEKADRKDAALVMTMCAYKQGHAAAALELGTTAWVRKKFAEAMEFYQEGTKFGGQDCAWAMSSFFDAQEWYREDTKIQDEFRRLNIMPDTDRASRYEAISDALKLNPDLRFTRLDQALPLPPAQLPDWRGIEDAIEPETGKPLVY